MSRVVDVSTTDPKPSNSGAMFAALMAVAANNGAPLSDDVPHPDVLGTLLTAVSNK